MTKQKMIRIIQDEVASYAILAHNRYDLLMRQAKSNGEERPNVLNDMAYQTYIERFNEAKLIAEKLGVKL